MFCQISRIDRQNNQYFRHFYKKIIDQVVNSSVEKNFGILELFFELTFIQKMKKELSRSFAIDARGTQEEREGRKGRGVSKSLQSFFAALLWKT